jgi:hypothetical protein
MSNLELWNKVQKTNQSTQKICVRGNKITSISPQFQIMNVTGLNLWREMGFKNLVLDYSLAKDFGLVVLNATFFF